MMLPSCPPAYSGNAIIFEVDCPDILVGLIVTKEVRFVARGTDKDIGNTYIIIFFRLVDMFFLQPFTNVEVRAEWNTETLALAYWRAMGRAICRTSADRLPLDVQGPLNKPR
jgi:hypothetical protein